MPAAAALLGIGLAGIAVVDAWFAIPGAEPLPFIPIPVSDFTGEQGVFYGSYGYAWGADGAWFFLLLAGGLGILALLELRAAVRRARVARGLLPRAMSRAVPRPAKA